MTVFVRKTKIVDGNECKWCNACRTFIPFDGFSIKKSAKGTPIYDSYCKLCKSSDMSSYRNRTKRQAVDYLGNKCADCDRSYPLAVYDFHHLDPDEKDFSMSSFFLKKISWEERKVEIDKCALLCANCHRIRHMNERLGLSSIQ